MKKYPIEKQGEFYSPVYYFVVYSGDKKLRFQLDSGSTQNTICEKSLQGCVVAKTNTKNSTVGFMGETLLQDTVIIDITTDQSQDCRIYELTFQVLPVKYCGEYIEEKSDGLLGAQFIQFCRIDFRNCWIEVGERLGAIPSLLKNNAEYFKEKQLVNQTENKHNFITRVKKYFICNCTHK